MERLDKKAMIRFWPILVVAIVFLSSCTTIPEEVTTVEKCSTGLSMKEGVADSTERNPLISTKHSLLTGDKVMIFMAAFNSTPPKSSYDPDTIVIFVAPTDPRAVLGFVKDDCIMSAHAYPLAVVAAWMEGKPVFFPGQPSNEEKI